MDCPTKDNVRVNVDINLMFRINPEEKAVKSFVYKLGAARLDDILQVEIDEAIRNFVRAINHDQILDLKSEMALNMIEELNKKFTTFGVIFENASISAINLPSEFEKSMAETTGYDLRLQNQMKKNQNSVLVIENEQNQKLIELKKENITKLFEAKGARDRALLERDEKMVSTQTVHDVQIIETHQKASLLKINAENEKVIAENLSKKQVATIVAQAKTEAYNMKTKVDQKYKTKEIEADAKYQCALLHSESVKTEALSEQAASASMQKKRQFEFQKTKTEVLETLAKNGKLVFGGENGDELLKEIAETVS